MKKYGESCIGLESAPIMIGAVHHRVEVCPAPVDENRGDLLLRF